MANQIKYVLNLAYSDMMNKANKIKFWKSEKFQNF